MTAKFLRFLGSIKLAVPLLVAIVAILIGATFAESRIGSPTIQQMVYKSPWFGGLMFLLAVNLAVSTLLRYPWRGARKLGFALTHWGLIVIIAGSAAVIHLSTEGLLLVRTDGAPGNLMRVEGDLLEVLTPDQPAVRTSLFVRPDGPVSPSQVGDLRLLQYQESTLKTVQFQPGGSVPNPAVHLRLSSNRMGQTVDRWLAIAPTPYRQMSLGPATLELQQAEDAAALEAALAKPPPPSSTLGQLQVTLAGEPQLLEVSTVPQTLRLDPDTAVTVEQFWPDFRLDAHNQPISASDQRRNPAVQVTVRQGDQQESWFVFARPGLEPIRTTPTDRPLAQDWALTVAPAEPQNRFRVVVDQDGQLYYAARSSQGFQSGPLAVGQAISPGWADFTLTLVEALSAAQLDRQIVPVAPGTLPSEEAAPALQVALPDGSTHWLPWGEPTALETAQEDYYAAFGPRLYQLPFFTQLDDFIVERNEGSESVAMWTSVVTLGDPHTGETVQRRVWMNHPTWFKGWKIAQASWNPGDLSQSTLQIKREPTWVTALTWSGSLLVVLGIAVMFYGPAVMKGRRQAAVPSVQPQPEPGQATPLPQPNLQPDALPSWVMPK